MRHRKSAVNITRARSGGLPLEQGRRRPSSVFPFSQMFRWGSEAALAQFNSGLIVRPVGGVNFEVF